jgi:phospho-N-acetylmuramoyl-pentapeptide-transferase
MIIFLLTIILSLLTIQVFMKIMKKIDIGQIVREEGPSSHMKKSGTITMGGIPFILVTLIVFIIKSMQKGINYQALLIIYLVLSFSVIGFIDDYIKNVKHSPYGLKGSQSILLQIIFSIPFIFIVYKLNISYINIVLFFLFEIIFILSTANSVNLTDGLDGLLAGISIPILFVFFMINKGNIVGSYSIILSAALIGFLFYNFYPAKIFMGNIGSFAIGGSIAAIAILSRAEFILLILGSIFVIEALSVIIQVLYFKYTKHKYGAGKRIFLMSPIHHHFELLGLPEPLIVVRFWIIQILLSSISLIFFK